MNAGARRVVALDPERWDPLDGDQLDSDPWDDPAWRTKIEARYDDYLTRVPVWVEPDYDADGLVVEVRTGGRWVRVR
jgi:hypothetical protein